jgi:GT2 family glycosyltransferase
MAEERVQLSPELPIGEVSPTLKPRAAVIIVNFNGKADIERCIHSVFATIPVNVEVVVLDNASTDGSPELIEQTFPSVRLLRSTVNGGFGYGNNRAAGLTQADHLVFLNPDTEVTNGWIERLLCHLESAEDVGLVTAKILLMSDPNRINTCGCDVHISGLSLCRDARATASSVQQSTELGSISGAAFAIRRSLFDQLGGFDERFFLYMEDTDLSLRARLAGFRILLAHDAEVHHDYELTFGPKKTFYQERNRYYILLKVWKWRTLLMLLPSLLAAEVLTWSFVLLRDRSNVANKLCAYLWIAQHWSNIMAARARTQRLRCVSDRNLLRLTTARLDFEQVASTRISSIAHAIFDPIFRTTRQLALATVQW